MRNEIKGGILVMIAAFLWGISGTFAKLMFNTSIKPFELANMRLNASFAILFLYFLIAKREIIKVKRDDFKYFFIMGIFGIAAVQTTYYYTISTLSVSMAIFLQYLSPIIIMSYSVIFLKERLTRLKLMSLLFAFVGSVLIIFGGGSSQIPLKPIGVITGVASAFFGAFYTLYSKRCTETYNPWTVILYSFGAGAFFYWFISPPWTVWSGRTAPELLFVLYIAVFATILPFGLSVWGIKYLQPSVAGIISMLEPVVASLSAYIIIGETMNFAQMTGGVFVIGAVLLLQYRFTEQIKAQSILVSKEE